MADEPVFLYLATYDSVADAQFDFDAVKALHKDHMIGTYDAAVITKVWQTVGKLRRRRRLLMSGELAEPSYRVEDWTREARRVGGN